MTDKTITRESFNHYLASFVTIIRKHECGGCESESTAGSWVLHNVQGRPLEQFLVKKQLRNCKYFVTCLDHIKEEACYDIEEIDLDHSFLEAEADNGCTYLSSSDEISVTFEYHIVYSPSFSVPVLYFNAFHLSGKLLSLDEIWSLVPAVYQTRLQHEKWAFITQQEHPCLGRPFFMLHPCHTAELVGKLTAGINTSQDTKSNWNYLITWLSAVGPVLGLELPLQCGQES